MASKSYVEERGGRKEKQAGVNLTAGRSKHKEGHAPACSLFYQLARAESSSPTLAVFSYLKKKHYTKKDSPSYQTYDTCMKY
jgi:hypothetical protein